MGARSFFESMTTLTLAGGISLALWLGTAVSHAVTIPHAFALGPLPWLMMSELYPNRIRARAVSITTTVLWITAFFPVMLFPILQGWSERQFGSVVGVFAVYAGICVLSFFFGWLLLPETKGRSLESIADSWCGVPREAPDTLSEQWPAEDPV